MGHVNTSFTSHAVPRKNAVMALGESVTGSETLQISIDELYENAAIPADEGLVSRPRPSNNAKEVEINGGQRRLHVPATS